MRARAGPPLAYHAGDPARDDRRHQLGQREPPGGNRPVDSRPLLPPRRPPLRVRGQFQPQLWLEPRAEDGWPLVPFSAGPGECAGRNLVLLLTSSVLAALLAEHDLRQPRPRFDGRGRLPATLSPFSLSFDLRRR